MKPKKKFRTALRAEESARSRMQRILKERVAVEHFRYPACLEADLEQSEDIRTLVGDDEFARELYSALCNLQWTSKAIDFDAYYKDRMNELLAEGRKYTFDDSWSASWRSSGGIVADLRNRYHNTSESYMDWYCSGFEGEVSDRLVEELDKIGWVPRPWPAQ